MKQKLTLSIDSKIVYQAKLKALKEKTFISNVVEKKLERWLR